MTGQRSTARLAAAAFAALLLLPLVAVPASAQTEGQVAIRSLDVTCEQNEVPRSPFTDIRGHTFEKEIECLVFYEITSGRTRNTYEPNAGVLRGQMATFIANAIDYMSVDAGLNDLPPYDGTNRFSDVKPDNVHLRNINRLAAAGVVLGKTSTEFDPNAPVTRAQMATFLNGAQRYLTGDAFESAEDFFDDDDGNTHETNINAVAGQGVAGGTSGRNYDPLGTVRRGQMAAFIMRLIDVNVEAGRVTTQYARLNPTNATLAFRQLFDTTVTTISDNDAPNRGAVQFRVTGLRSAVDLAVFDCGDVFVDASQYRFRDADNNNRADLVDDRDGAIFETVNGQAQGVAGRSFYNNASPQDGVVTFTVNARAVDCVRAVAWVDTNSNNALDLGADERPTETFGLQLDEKDRSGELRYVAEEAGNGLFPSGTVLVVAKDTNVFSFSNASYRFDSTDQFFTSSGGQLDFAAFKSRVSRNDTIQGSYDRTGSSRFFLNDAAPLAPTNVRATAAGSAVTVTWTASTTPGVEGYVILRAPTSTDCDETQTGADREGTYAPVGKAQGYETTFVNTGVADGRYCYRVRAVDDGDESGDSADLSAPVLVRSGPDSTSPQITDAEVTENGPVPPDSLQVDAGDQHVFTFNEAMDTDTARPTSAYTLEDDDGTRVTITCGARPNDNNAATTDCALDAAATKMTVNLGTTGVGEATGGTFPGVQYPATVVDVTTDWRDLSGNILSLTNNPSLE